jgi:hypothetical protein
MKAMKIVMVMIMVAAAAMSVLAFNGCEQPTDNITVPVKEDPGKQDPGKEDPGKEDPGKEDPGKEDPAAIKKAEDFAKIEEAHTAFVTRAREIRATYAEKEKEALAELALLGEEFAPGDLIPMEGTYTQKYPTSRNERVTVGTYQYTHITIPYNDLTPKQKDYLYNIRSSVFTQDAIIQNSSTTDIRNIADIGSIFATEGINLVWHSVGWDDENKSKQVEVAIQWLRTAKRIEITDEVVIVGQSDRDERYSDAYNLTRYIPGGANFIYPVDVSGGIIQQRIRNNQARNIIDATKAVLWQRIQESGVPEAEEIYQQCVDGIDLDTMIYKVIREAHIAAGREPEYESYSEFSGTTNRLSIYNQPIEDFKTADHGQVPSLSAAPLKRTPTVIFEEQHVIANATAPRTRREIAEANGIMV